jgi:hypothetical protein
MASIAIHLDDSEVHQLADDIGRHADTMPVMAQRVMDKGGHDMQAAAQTNAPVDTGALKASISLDIFDLGFVLGPTVDYGGFVERGVPHPYVIHAKPGGTLAFPGAGGGIVFARSVVHPPMAPQPYLSPAFDAVLPHIEDALGALGEQVTSRG